MLAVFGFPQNIKDKIWSQGKCSFMDSVGSDLPSSPGWVIFRKLWPVCDVGYDDQYWLLYSIIIMPWVVWQWPHAIIEFSVWMCDCVELQCGFWLNIENIQNGKTQNHRLILWMPIACGLLVMSLLLPNPVWTQLETQEQPQIESCCGNIKYE